MPSLQVSKGLVNVTNGSQVVRANLYLQFKNWNGREFQAQSLDASTPGEYIHAAMGGGQCTATVNNTTLRDGTRSWLTNQWAGYQVLITQGAAAGSIRNVVSNTGTDLVVGVALAGVPDANTFFVILGIGFVVGSSTSSTLSDTSKAWATDVWKDMYVHIILGTGVGQVRQIASNTGTVLTVVGTWDVVPDGTSNYRIVRAANRATALDEPLGNLFVMNEHGIPIGSSDPLLPIPFDFVYGVTSRAQGELTDIETAIDFVAEGVSPGHMFSITADNSEQYIPYTIAGGISSGQLSLNANYAGTTRYGTAYLIHTDFDAVVEGLPLPSPRVIALPVIVRAGFLAISRAFGQLGLVTSLVGNAKKSLRVKGDETGLELVKLMPVDASDAFTALVTGPSLDPTLPNHLVRKAYVDAADALLLDVAATRGLSGPLVLDYATLFSGSVNAATTTTLSVSGSPWTADQFNNVPNGYVGYRVRIRSGPSAGQYSIVDTASNQLTISPGFTSVPANGTAFEVIDINENRIASSRSYVDRAVAGSIANPLMPFEFETTLLSDVVCPNASLIQVGELSQAPFPGADGVRRYRVKIRVAAHVDTGSGSDNRLVIFLARNSLGVGITTLIVSQSIAMPTYGAVNLGFTYQEIESLAFVPLATDLLSVCALAASHTVTINGAAGPASQTSLLVREVLERAA